MLEPSIIQQISYIKLPIIKLKINWWWEEFEKGAASYLLSLRSFKKFQLGIHLSSDAVSGNLACDRNCSKFFNSKSKFNTILKPK